MAQSLSQERIYVAHAVVPLDTSAAQPPLVGGVVRHRARPGGFVLGDVPQLAREVAFLEGVQFRQMPVPRVFVDESAGKK
jgi:hypothetical protein